MTHNITGSFIRHKLPRTTYFIVWLIQYTGRPTCLRYHSELAAYLSMCPSFCLFLFSCCCCCCCCCSWVFLNDTAPSSAIEFYLLMEHLLLHTDCLACPPMGSDKSGVFHSQFFIQPLPSQAYFLVFIILVQAAMPNYSPCSIFQNFI